MDVEFKDNYKEIESFALLYAPFELYTNFRIRNQILILSDVIQQLKLNFNKEFQQFIVEKNSILEKFNANKTAIEILKDLLGDVQVENYNIAVNPHEDNEWVLKVEESDIKVPRYFSKEERLKLEEEQRKEQERIKALQGDTCK